MATKNRQLADAQNVQLKETVFASNLDCSLEQQREKSKKLKTKKMSKVLNNGFKLYPTDHRQESMLNNMDQRRTVTSGQQSIEMHDKLEQPSVQDNLIQTNIDLGSTLTQQRKTSKIDFMKPQDQLVAIHQPPHLSREADSPTSLKSIMKNKETDLIPQQVHFEKTHEQFTLDL